MSRHTHFHTHDTRAMHAHEHDDGDYRTAHAHSTRLTSAPAIPRAKGTLDLDHEKMASPPKPIRSAEK